MSQRKYDHIWSCKNADCLEQKIGEKVAEILRQEYAGKASPMKNISSKTGITADTIRKWYSGRKPPHLAHFLILAQNYPTILCMFLEAVRHDYLIPHIQPQGQGSEITVQTRKKEPEVDQNVPINVPINSWPAGLNERQIWFLTELSRSIRIAAEDIARCKNVTGKTAKRDIANLKARRLIRFVGAKKTGSYLLLDANQRKK